MDTAIDKYINASQTIAPADTYYQWARVAAETGADAEDIIYKVMRHNIQGE